MRMNDIGAARTELAMSALATKVVGVDMRSAAFDLKAFSYALWGMALNNAGWMLVAAMPQLVYGAAGVAFDAFT